MEVEKIRIGYVVTPQSHPWPWDSGWEQIDRVLVGLVERPGYQTGLEVEFLIHHPCDLEKFPDVRMDTYLPRFTGHEKGRVTVRDLPDGPPV